MPLPSETALTIVENLSVFESCPEAVETIANAIKEKKIGDRRTMLHNVKIAIAKNLKAFSCSPKAQKDLAEAIIKLILPEWTSITPESQEIAMAIAENLSTLTDSITNISLSI